MKDYLIILNMGKDYKLPLHLKSHNHAEALLKASEFCVTEGYYPMGIDVILLHSNIGIIEI
ncbi:hypothetical protein [Enterocloster bolteae]|jgi:hypothetical protein|uniref:Uncharacterized protein n=1 Tax=Enterocloster bolteae 90B8 TaxID=997897 RepID=R0AZ55_9FIRM|nr:hypothetical protein [Enterocloster bolteae]ENZ38074.1 hypothetical protein HMPREF1097_02656 [Enterocloster bolteae 90B8]RGO78069.1 hypothetical protein DXB04_27605 [Enterocloster bolteae]